jgi:hypothetical protein
VAGRDEPLPEDELLDLPGRGERELVHEYQAVARLSGVIRAMAGRGVQSVDWNRALGALSRPAVDGAYRELGTREVERLAREGPSMSLEDVLEEALAERPPARRE